MHWSQTKLVSVETIRRFGELAVRDRDAGLAAQAWSDAGFDDERAAEWLGARCFDAGAARAMEDLGLTPAQASTRTRDGRRDYIDTIAFKVASGDLSPRQAAARAASSR